jgi:hypothetical protein
MPVPTELSAMVLYLSNSVATTQLRLLKYGSNDKLNYKILAGHQWLTPVILVTQEAEIKRIMV